MVQKILIGGIGVIILSLIITVVMLSRESMGPMVNETDLRRDNLRLEHLKVIATQVQVYWDKHHSLPATIGNLIDRKSFKKLPKDPRYSTDYEYNIVGDQHYQLCAIFSIETPRRKDDISKPGFWYHKSDHYCFNFVVAQILPATPNELIEN